MEKSTHADRHPPYPVNLTPAGFEQQVLTWLRSLAEGLAEFTSNHQAVATGRGGDYSIDILATFSVFGGAKVIVLVECKHQKRPIERDEVMILEGKLRAIGAHKGILFSTSGFQAGAIRYGASVGIATVSVDDGSWVFQTRSLVASDPSFLSAVWLTVGDDGSAIADVELLPVIRNRFDALRSWLF